MTMFNIAALAVTATAPLHLKSAQGELLYADAEKKLPIIIHVHGPGSDAFAAVESRQSNRAVKRMQDNDGKVTLPPYEQRLKEAAEDLAAITAGFENFNYEPAGGVSGEALYRAVYADQKLGFITKQVTKFVADWGNFSGGSATS
ncbi:hypothetical protein [Sphingomonas mucosissima]|uniref:Uncharacterized protein n=1 Tax=Sphingomonas mucosissima TaxID=370959 RepID=A0A245ZRB9_9SPHN|nr:hypothetical protein [Sphingomonas mucosissima]OWK32298.1 hypothetical protein SPMU_06200 [Sphingomonas mucosissima]